MVAFHVLRNVTVPLSSASSWRASSATLPRNATAWSSFLDQVAEYDKKAYATAEAGDAQLEIFVVDEVLRHPVAQAGNLTRKPQSFQDIHPAVPARDCGRAEEARKAARACPEMLDQNFLCYDGSGEVPSQIHAYLSTNYKELRGLPKDHPALRDKGRSRWYVPDPTKAADVEMRRTRILLREFEEYCRSPQRRLKLFPSGGDPGRLLQGVPGPGLRDHHRNRREDPGGRPPGGPEAPALV